MMRRLVVMPKDSSGPIIAAIENARKSLRIKMFSLSDSKVLDALLQAYKRKVKIRVLLNASRHGGELQNKGSRSLLDEAGIDVLDTSPAYAVTHEKSMVVDDTTVFVCSFNFDRENFQETRDFAVISRHPAEVTEVIECFDADWSRESFMPRQASALIWSPGHSRERIAEFISSAKHSLFVQNERFQDAIIVERLVRARMRGVKVHIMTRPSHSLRANKLIEGLGDLRIMRDVGIGVRKIRHFKLHAKMLLVDQSRAVIGSTNLTASSFDERRELSMYVSDPAVISRLVRIVRSDWKHSHELDLSDKGVLSDLERHPKNGGLAKMASIVRHV